MSTILLDKLHQQANSAQSINQSYIPYNMPMIPTTFLASARVAKTFFKKNLKSVFKDSNTVNHIAAMYLEE